MADATFVAIGAAARRWPGRPPRMRSWVKPTRARPQARARPGARRWRIGCTLPGAGPRSSTMPRAPPTWVCACGGQGAVGRPAAPDVDPRRGFLGDRSPRGPGAPGRVASHERAMAREACSGCAGPGRPPSSSSCGLPIKALCASRARCRRPCASTSPSACLVALRVLHVQKNPRVAWWPCATPNHRARRDAATTVSRADWPAGPVRGAAARPDRRTKIRNP